MLKYTVLEMLKGSSGHISGEEISRRLGVSRTMIWKTVKELREDGYIIGASTKKGYLFDNNADVLNEYEAGPGIFGSEITFIREVDSTNSYLKERASEGSAREGACVICERQLHGRGRMGREWYSPVFRNISMSVLLTPDIPPYKAAGFSLLAGVCVYEALCGLNIEGLRIKWPNDIMIKDRKVCGILAEMTSELDRINFMVIGIGINVYSSKDEMPDEPGIKAVSLEDAAACGKKGLNRAKIIKEVLKRIETEYLKNKNGITEELLLKWKEYSDTIGRKISYHIGNDVRTGTVEDIGNDGALAVSAGEAVDKVHSGMIFEMEGY